MFKEMNDLPEDTNLGSMRFGILTQNLQDQKTMFYIFHEHVC